MDENILPDQHKQNFNENPNLLKIMHLNAQSLSSTSDAFQHLIHETSDAFQHLIHDYPFDIACIIETWLTSNKHQLSYVQIPNYTIHCNNRTDRRGGGVGIYVKESIKHHIRKDVMDFDTNLEHLWIEFHGINRNSNILVCVIYQPIFTSQEKELWLERVDNVLSKVSYLWSGPVIFVGDMNIDMTKADENISNKYVELMQCYDLHQHVTQPSKGKALIDHIWTNIPNKVKVSDLLLCDELSDHDAPYVFINTKVDYTYIHIHTDYHKKCYKFIRHLRVYDENDYINDVKLLPFNIVYAVEDPDEKILS